MRRHSCSPLELSFRPAFRDPAFRVLLSARRGRASASYPGNQATHTARPSDRHLSRKHDGSAGLSEVHAKVACQCAYDALCEAPDERLEAP